MASRLTTNRVSACKALDKGESMATYVEISLVQENLEFLLSFVAMADEKPQDIESCCLPGMRNLIQDQLDRLSRAVERMCPEDEAEGVQ